MKRFSSKKGRVRQTCAVARWRAIIVDGVGALNIIASLDYRISAVAKSPVALIANFLPPYVAPWLNIALFYPIATLAIAALAGVAWYMNGFLRDRIGERARLVWTGPIAWYGRSNGTAGFWRSPG